MNWKGVINAPRDRCMVAESGFIELARISYSLVKIGIFRSQNVNEPSERQRMVFVRGNAAVLVLT